MNDKWLIWSLEHRAWWAPNRNGYTNVRSEAGRYGYIEALEIVLCANRYITRQLPNEAMCPDWETT